MRRLWKVQTTMNSSGGCDESPGEMNGCRSLLTPVR
jgi:hypothetical protein